MDSQASLDQRVIPLIQQYLKENGLSDTLNAFEKETGTLYDEDSMKMGSELLMVLNEYSEIQMALKFNQLDCKDPEHELVVVSDAVPIQKMHQSIDSIHTSNIISLSFSFADDNLIATGSSDKTIRIINLSTNEVQCQFTPANAAILSVDFNPYYRWLVLSSSMDGKHFLLDTRNGQVIQHFHNHQKYVVRAIWSPTDPRLFVTASHDKSIGIYSMEKREEGEEDNPDEVKQFILQKKIEFHSLVEAIEFTRDGTALIVGLREDNYLNFIDLATYQNTRINMNLNGDDHVSFTAMDLSCSPSGNHLLVATDRNFHILFRCGTATQVRRFYGAMNDGFSHPKVCWDPSGKFIYSTSQDNQIYVWDTITQKIVAKLAGHKSVLRDMKFHPTKHLLGTCSFDKTIKFWE